MKGFRYYRNCTLSILMAISGLALFVFLLSQPLYGLPDKSELKKVSGKVSWFKVYHRSGIRFKLDSGNSTFEYPSAARSISKVKRALKVGFEKPVTLLIKPNDENKSYLTSKENDTVYQVSIDNSKIISYEDVKIAWRKSIKIGMFLGLFFFCGGVYLYKEQKKSNYNPIA